MDLAIPEVVRRKAELEGRASWVDDLPAVLAGLAEEWSLTIGPVFDGGTEAFVAAAVDAAGAKVVLKLMVPRGTDVVADEITVLRLADGDGCVRLLRVDLDRGALLLERLGPSMFDLGLPFEQRLPILADLAARIWRPAPDCGLPTGAQKAGWLAELIPSQWESLGRPCAEAAIEHALTCASRRGAAHDDERARLLHGDVQQWNALQTPDGSFTLIDPDGLLAEPEYDLGILMREDPVELVRDGPFARAQWLANRTGCDALAIWEWGVIERVSTGLLAAAVGLQPAGDQMLRAAEVAVDVAVD